MITPERYEVIKKFGNVLFMFHLKQASPQNKEKLKNLLKKMVLTKEFHWTTNPLTKEVVVTFWLGKMTVTVGQDNFLVHIDEQTRENLKKYGREHAPSKKANSSIKTTSQPTVNSLKQIQTPSSTPNKRTENKMINSTNSSKDEYALAQEEAFRRYEEKEKKIPVPPKKIEKPVETDGPKGEPLFLGFLSDGDYAM